MIYLSAGQAMRRKKRAIVAADLPDESPSVSRVDPAEVFTRLADIVYQGSTVAEVYAAICVAATLMVPGCDHASVLLRRRKVGALNLFSDTPNVFSKRSAGRAIALAAFASVATNAVAQGEDAAALRRGLVSNREIGKAIGMLMVLNDISEDDAFDMLRRTSQDMNIKLANVAAEIVRRRSRPSTDEHA